MRTGQSVWSAEMPEDFLRATTRDEHHFDLVSKLGFTSFMSVPLAAGDRVLGSLTLVSAGSGRRFQESDLDLVEELAGHAAAVIDRARRHDREREAAHALQRTLLPDQLASVAGVATAAGYLAGTEGAEVGGDWYDAIPLPSGAVGLVIGDVAGHDIGAAGVMGQLRNALRAYAVREESPAAVLDQLREFAEVLDIDRIATVAYLWLSPLTGELRVASAGHLPPLLRRRSGEVELIEITPAPPLGVPSAAPAEARFALDVDDTVILLTDGLIETRGEDFDQGVDNLRALIEGLGDVSPLDLCDQILAWRLGTARREDDMCLLAARRT
jgi:serine/threonine-protein kinase RsbW